MKRAEDGDLEQQYELMQTRHKNATLFPIGLLVSGTPVFTQTQPDVAYGEHLDSAVNENMIGLPADY